MDGASQRSNGSRCLLFSIDEQFDHISLKQAYAGAVSRTIFILVR